MCKVVFLQGRTLSLASLLTEIKKNKHWGFLELGRGNVAVALAYSGRGSQGPQRGWESGGAWGPGEL